jgi:RND family efflux transporter MFP subunit
MMRHYHFVRNFVLHRSGTQTVHRLLLRWLSAGALVMALALQAAVAQHSAANVVTIRAQRMTPHLKAFAQVQPTATLPLNAPESGVVEGLSVVPGMHVHAHEVIARLSGPGIRNMLSQDEANLRSARTQLVTAKKTLAILKNQLRVHLSTREMVHQAESDVAKAQSVLDNARAQFTAVEQMHTITAPTNAIVLALNSHNGELLQPGQPVVTLQAGNSLWLVATYYGRQLHTIHSGMTGRFTASDGSTKIPVSVAAIFAAATPGGGESVALRPLHGHAAWMNGEYGSLTLNAPPRTLPVVPTRALILNQGKWWVLIHTSKGNHAQQVVPGPSEGWNTFIEHGLTPGVQVVTRNVYLLFHAQIAEHYQIPD